MVDYLSSQPNRAGYQVSTKRGQVPTCKIRDNGRVVNKAVYMAVGVDMEGIKHILGLWVATNEGAAFWSQVCAEIANRGVNDVFIVCCDGLKGFPEAIQATWPDSMVQT